MNLGILLEKSARTYDKNVATSHGDNSLTYDETNKRVNSLANAFLDLGVEKGDRVSIFSNNCPQLLESIFCCFRAGFVAVPINAKLTGGELLYIIRHSGSSAVIFGSDFENEAKEISRELPSIKQVALSNSRQGTFDYEKLVSSYSQESPRTEAQLDNLAWLFYTSGTTGRPKGAMLTHRNLIAMTMNFLADIFPLRPDDVGVHAAPLTHGSGLYAIPFIARGARNIIAKSKRFDPELIFKTVQERRATVLPFLSPTMIKMLLVSRFIGQYNLSSLKCVIYGGSPMYVEDMKEAVRRFGRILVQIYGLGEAPMTITYLSKENHFADPAQDWQVKRMQSAGIARTDVEIKIVDENRNDLPPSQMGEILVRGDIVMTGYWNDPEATTKTLIGGWLHTGDEGYVDRRGYLYIMDRSKDMIDSGGAKIYPREVEEVVLQHPAVQEVCVIGIPDRVWGEAVKAIVVSKAGTKTTESEIIEFCKGRIASFKKPRSVDFVETIPKNAYGKVLKRELRDRYWIGMERKV